MAKDFVLEIGTEEIPAKFMPGALKQLQELAEKSLAASRLKCQAVKSFGTPRRLALYIEGLADSAESVEVEAKGPSKKVAFDLEGNPSKAAMGFARGQGVEVKDLVLKEFNGEEYVYAVRQEIGKEAQQLLPELAIELINGLNFPKPMKWGYNEMRFARPIRWLVALHGVDLVEFEVANVKSGRTTRGHRFLGQAEFELATASDYVSDLYNKGQVIVDQEERRRIIWQQILQAAEAIQGQVEPDGQLLEEVVFLVEYPTALVGTFEDEYLKLPKEVLITPMKEHQRYFPVMDGQGELLNRFITVRNGDAEFLDIVAQGNEKVLRARLADAKFFYDEDLKTPLADNVERLKKIVFHESLGTIHQKVMRLQKFVAKLAELLELPDSTANVADRGVYLAKADLVTNMVYEFPELQGIMGQKYAQAMGENPAVAQVVFEHYLPRFSGDVVPESLAGTLASIADKMDTITGCFAIGIQPTGSQDPYALRRQALGVCHMLLAKDLEISLPQLIEIAYTGYGDEAKFTLDLEQVKAEIIEFFKLRVKNIFMEQGIKYDTVDAILEAGFANLPDTARRVQALHDFRENIQFSPLLQAFTRVNNLAKKLEPDMVLNTTLLFEAAEQELVHKFTEVKAKATSHAASGDYQAWFSTVAELRPQIDNFFAGVMVMAEDIKVRGARLALLASIADFFNSVADLTKVVE